MTLVGCYGSEDKLADCSHHEFELSSDGSVSSMDISIICDNVTSTVDPTDGMTTHDIYDKEMAPQALLQLTVILVVRKPAQVLVEKVVLCMHL